MTTETDIIELEAKLAAMTEDCLTCKGECEFYIHKGDGIWDIEPCQDCKGAGVPLIKGSRRDCLDEVHRLNLKELIHQLESGNAKARDDAGLGIADIDDPAAIPALERAIEREIGDPRMLADSLRLVLRQLQETKANDSQSRCYQCNDLGYVPSLSMEKVLDYVIRRGLVSFDVQTDTSILYCEWTLEALPTHPDIVAHVHLDGDMRPSDNYLVLLRAFLAGAEAMEASKSLSDVL